MSEITFLHPGFFWLLLLLPLAIGWYFLKRKQQSATLRISSVAGFKAAPSMRAKFKPALFGIRLLALLCMIIGLARPRTADVTSKGGTTKGIDIVMVVDVSNGMLARDLKPNRFEAMKKIARDLVGQRVNDRIGMVVYAAESYTKVPITSDKGMVKKAINTIDSDNELIGDGSAMGTALATGINRLKGSKAKSRIIILMSDGVNNSDLIDPLTSAKIASKYGIKIYTIGIGTNGSAEFPMSKAADGTVTYAVREVKMNEQLLTDIAKKANGKYFRATDNKKLDQIYKDIDKLETNELPETKYFNYKEQFRIFVWIALILLLLEAVARRTLYRSFI